MFLFAASQNSKEGQPPNKLYILQSCIGGDDDYFTKFEIDVFKVFY